MANNIRPFGIYKLNLHDWPVRNFDVADCQDLLPKGKRIRNKKKKRRLHNKTARAVAKVSLLKELSQAA